MSSYSKMANKKKNVKFILAMLWGSGFMAGLSFAFNSLVAAMFSVCLALISIFEVKK